MTYYSGNTIAASNFMDFRGPLGPDTPYPDDDTAAIGPIAALIGYGYGQRGYGQNWTFLPPRNPRQTVSHIEWNAMQAAMSNINIHTGSSLTMQPRVDVAGKVIAEDGVDSTANIEFLAQTLDSNRMYWETSQMIVNTAIQSSTIAAWANNLTSEYTIDFGDEDRARWFFNSGGALLLGGERTGGTSNVTITTGNVYSQTVYPVQYPPSWSNFMNRYAVWVDNPQQSNPVCISVINETSQNASTIQASYNKLRSQYPNYIIYLLQPTKGGYGPGDLKLPTGWSTINLDYGPISVATDYGDPAKRADWFAICNLDGLPPGSKVGIFLDDSGSLGTKDIKASYDYLLQRLTAKGITWQTVINNTENYIDPFINMNLSAGSTTPDLAGLPQIIYRTFTAPYTGNYFFRYQADNQLKLYADDAIIGTSVDFAGEPSTATVFLSAGPHILRFETLNKSIGTTASWSQNPAGWAVTISAGIWDARDHLPAEYVSTPLFTSPAVYPVFSNDGDWNSFMNTYAVWTNPDAKTFINSTQTIYRNINIPTTGTYTFTYAVDDNLIIYLDGIQIITSNVSTSRSNNPPGQASVSISAGNHVLKFEAVNTVVRGGWALTVALGTALPIWDTRRAVGAETIGVSGTTLSPAVYPVTFPSTWSDWMNDHAVWTSPATNIFRNITQDRYRNFNAPIEGTYLFSFAADDRITIYVDGILAATAYRNYDSASPATASVHMTAGNHVLHFEALNDGSGSQWSTNPAGWGLTIESIIWDTRSYAAGEPVVSTAYTSPEVYPVTSTAGDWNDFMNQYAVWVSPNAVSFIGIQQVRDRLLTITASANYVITYAIDDNMTISLNGVAVIGSDVTTSRSNQLPGTKVLYLAAGTYVLRVSALNTMVRGGWAITVQNQITKAIIWHTRAKTAAETIPGRTSANAGTSTTTYSIANQNISNLLAAAGTIVLDANNISVTGSGTVAVNGYYALTDSYQTVYTSYVLPAGANTTPTEQIAAVFTSPSQQYTWKVPTTVTSARFKLWGAGGAGANKWNVSTVYPGGAGAYIDAQIPVVPGETLIIKVGGGGLPGVMTGAEGNFGGGGGGYTAVFRGTTPLLIASAGGGAPSNGLNGTRPGGRAGAGGITIGQPGTQGNGTINSTGGSQTAGGTGGVGDDANAKGTSGGFLNGGIGGSLSTTMKGQNGGINGGAQSGNYGSAGGGGGYFGGGGGGAATNNGSQYSSGGGAGGSSYIHPDAFYVYTEVSPDGVLAPNSNDPDFKQGVCQGGAAAGKQGNQGMAGGPGLVIIYTTGTVIPYSADYSWVVQAKRENYSGTYGGNGSVIKLLSKINSISAVDGNTITKLDRRKAAGVLVIQEPNYSVTTTYKEPGPPAPTVSPPIPPPVSCIPGTIFAAVYAYPTPGWWGTPIIVKYNVPASNINWANHDDVCAYFGVPGTGYTVIPKGFCVRWLGNLTFPESGQWTISVEHSHGAWLWIDQTNIFASDSKFSITTDSTTKLFTAGKKYVWQLDMEYELEYSATYPFRSIWKWTNGSSGSVPQPTIIPMTAFCVNPDSVPNSVNPMDRKES